jgi:hypothetical protein
VWSADDNEIDRAIDAVAQQMTAGEPSGSLRARVVDRLGDRHTTRRPVWIGVSVAAAAAAIVIALFVARDRHENVVAPPTVAHNRTAPPAAPPTTMTQPPTSAPPAATVIAANDTRPVRATSRTVRQPIVQPSAVAALAPDVLDVTSIRLAAIEPAASIRLPQLNTIEPIAVQPLGEPQGDRP